MTSFFSFLWGLLAPPRASRLGLLRKDKDKRKRKKETYSPASTSPQEFAHRYNYFVSLYLWGSASVGSSDLFASQQDDLCDQFHGVYPGRFNYPCGSVPASLYL